MNNHSVLIGIQARSTSERFPSKVFEMIGQKPMLKHVVDACTHSANYLNKLSHKTMASIGVALLIPHNDPIAENYYFRNVPTVQGDEHDVLSRYYSAMQKLKPDYIVRITGDCPLIPPYLISKMVKLALINKYDYLSNVEPSARTAIDGFDCEVMSDRALRWMHETAKTKYDREHVTPLMRTSPPEWANRGGVINNLNFSDMKLSVDTQEDLTNVRVQYDKVREAAKNAEEIFGRGKVHWF